jgi:RimJ/RimL family protein N-acetyltransferase/N-acetylglutamate synthase-like GNAT family acetyltransferase
VEIVDVDPREDRAFGSWFAVVDTVTRHDRPGETAWVERELRAEALEGLPADDGSPPPDELREHLAVTDGGQVVAAARLELPQADNRHVAFFWLGVLPEQRRRGVATRLLDEITARAAAAGRSRLMVDLDEPPHLAGRSPGRAFAAGTGFACALEEVRRDLDLPVDEEHLAAVDREALPLAPGYRLLTLAERWPDDLVDARAELGRRMSTDVPLQDLDWREEAWDASRVRRFEQRFVDQGRRLLAAGAVHEASGDLVAFTEVAVPLAAPERVWQWDTLVVAEHRGRRLGTLVKTALLRRLQAEVPQARRVTTTNAGTNAYMIAVNERLGFRPNGTLTTWQRGR